MVGLDRLELSTSPLSGVRSSHLSYRPGFFLTGGAGRDRTGDLLNANQARSQLSYSPKKIKSRPIGCRAVSTRPTTTLTTSMNFRQESGTYFQHSAVLNQKTDPRQLCTGLDWNGCHSYTQSGSSHGLFRKEVIQPQVLLRLPCYDFTPIMSHTLGRCLPCGLACRLLVQPTFVM